MNRDIETFFPQSGRVIREDNTVINRADYAQAERESGVVQASRDGTLYRGWFQGTIASDATGWFALVPPPGLIVYGESRVITLLAGEIKAQFLAGGTLGNKVGSNLPAFNFNVADGSAPQSTFAQYDTITGAEAHSPESLITAPTSGPISQPAQQTSVGAHVKINNTKFAAFSIRNDSGADANVTLFITWQELP